MEELKVDKRKILSQIKDEICKLREVEITYVFGSFCRQESEFNDIDLALVIKGSYNNLSNEKTAQRVARELERRIEPRLELDVKILNSAPITFQYEIIKNGSLMFSRDENKRIEYESSVISEYLDYKETEDFLIENLLKG